MTPREKRIARNLRESAVIRDRERMRDLSFRSETAATCRAEEEEREGDTEMYLRACGWADVHYFTGSAMNGDAWRRRRAFRKRWLR